MQKPDFLTQLLDPVRAKLLRLLILNGTEEMTAAEAARRVGVSVPAAEKELNSLVKIEIVKAQKSEGKTARERISRYSFEGSGRHANALSAFVHECSPERFGDVEKVLRGTGRLNTIVLSGVFIGDKNRPADLLVVGDYVNEKRLEKVVKSFEPKYGREIRYALFSTPEFRYRLTIHDKLIRNTLDYPHRVLLNKRNLV